MSTQSGEKTHSKLQEINLRSLKVKEESISTILTTIKNNQSFAKLLIFSLNSLETFIIFPNKEIKLNSAIIINLDGVKLLHNISLKNIKNEEIIKLVGEIIYKLISINDIIDKELTKLLAEKNGHKMVIDITLKANNKNKAIIPYIKIINCFVQISQLVPILIENNILDTINLDTNLNFKERKNEVKFTQLNLDILKQISTQKIGRDYLINKNYIEKIIKNIIENANKKNVGCVLCALIILENLCRNEEGKKAVKNSNCIDCLSHILTQLGYEQSILKMCAKLYCKIASRDDLKSNLELLKNYYEENKSTGKYDNNFVDINKSLELISNFLLVDELGMYLQDKNIFELLKNLFIQVQQIDLKNKDNKFIILFISLNKNYMLIFFRLFNLDQAIIENNSDLIDSILASVQKIWESSKTINSLELLKCFNSYFVLYGEILNQIYNLFKKNENKINKEFIDSLIYINKNILISGQKNLNINEKDSNSHCIASRLLKICDELSLKEDSIDKTNKNKEIILSLIDCYSYLEFLFIKKNDEEILCNSLEVIFDLVSSQKDFRKNKLEQIIFKICEFMDTKKNQRYPCLLCLKLIDMFLTPEYIKEYIRARDPRKYPTHAINYLESISNVMIYRETLNEKKFEKNPEKEINILGEKIIERLVDELDFRKLIKEFISKAESFEPHKNNKENINKLENNIKEINGNINVKNYFDIGSNEILNSLQNLIEKEVKYIEFFKRDKSNEKNPNYQNIIESASLRIYLELSLNLKINSISQQKMKFDIYTKTLDILFIFLLKSLDIINISFILNYLKANYNFILNNENNIVLQNKEKISEKLVSVIVSLFRKLIEEDDIIYSIIDNLNILAENNILLCNNMVKAGCPRLLLQIIETSSNKYNVESALYLLKIISFSNKENLQIIATQNALNVFFQAKNKFHTNNKIINYCDEITKEILKLPGQEKYIYELINDTIKEFNINSQKDFAQNEIRQKLFNSLQIINSFASNQTQVELINNNEEFNENFKNIIENTFKEKELDSLNEKLINNELSLLKKISNNKYFENEYIIDKIIDIIKNKSSYQDILLSATEEFLKNASNENLYEKYISKKIDNSFVDYIFEDIDNYLGNIKVTKNLNNILCYLCLYNKDLAKYIKQKGGLLNVLEELKMNIDGNDKNSQYMKLISLKMLYSFCNDKEGIEIFLNAGGVELLNRLIEEEISLYTEYKNNVENELYKTRDILTITKNNVKEDEEQNESYIIYSIKLLQNIINTDEKYFNNDKIINNLVFISDVKYPNKEIFIQLSNLYFKNIIYLPKDEKYIILLLKNVLSLKCKYFTEKEFIENIIDKTIELLLTKKLEINDYLINLQNSLNNNKINPLQLSYLSEYIIDSEKYNQDISTIFNDIEQFGVEYFNYYKEKESNIIQEEIPEGIIISLQKLLIYILKINKENNLNIYDIVNTFILMSHQNLCKVGHELFSLFYLQNIDSFLDNTENNEIKDKAYKVYLNSVTIRSIEMLSYIHQLLIKDNDYNSLNDSIKLLFDLILKNIKNFYSDKDINAKLLKLDVILNIISDLINDFNNMKNIEEKKRIKIINCLYNIQIDIFLKIQKEDSSPINRNIIMEILDYMKTSKENNYKEEENIFPKLINSILQKIDYSSEIYEKINEFILEDLNQSPPHELEINLDSLIIQSRDIITIKKIINNDELISKFLKLYNNDSISQRRNISNLFFNLLKNNLNAENIIENKPELIKMIIDKLILKNNIIKDEENIDIAKIELNTIVSLLKDENNSYLLFNKQLLKESNIHEIINNYKNVHASLRQSLDELDNILNILASKKDKVENYKLDESILNDLVNTINQAFQDHLNELKTLNTDEFNNNINNIEDINDNSIESLSNIKKRKLSIISYHLFYNHYNNQINSQISTKNDDMYSILDNLFSLIRKLYSNNKDFKDKDIQTQRLSLLNKALDSLKKFTICPDNHKNIEENGLFNFMEKLNNKEDFKIYLTSLDILKNCTWSENAVLLLIESKLFDKVIEEILEFYENPKLITENNDKKNNFFYDSIVLSNISKFHKGFEIIYNKIGLEKLIKICKISGDLDFLTSFFNFLNYLFENSKFNDELNNQNIINDILEISKKGFNSNIDNINENLFFKTIKLIGNIYNEKFKDSMSQMDIVKIINLTFDKYKDEPEYFYNIIYTLKIISPYNEKYSNEIVDLKLINKIIEQIIINEQNDDLIINHSKLLHNLLINNEENTNKMCNEEIINNILYYISKYSEKFKNINQKGDTYGFVNLIDNIYENDLSNENDNTFKEYNLILNNFLNTLKLLSSNEKSKDYINNDKYITCLLHTIDKEKIDLENIFLSLFCLGNYFIKIDKDKWKNEHIQEVYFALQLLQKTYYTNGDILININKLIGYILKVLSLKFLVERFYTLALEGINCQDWNEKLILLTFDIIKQCLIQNKELKYEIFENTVYTILYILKVFPNLLTIQVIGYEILVLFTDDESYAYVLANSDIFSTIRNTLSNMDFNNEPEKKLKVRLAIYKLINYLTYDEKISLNISLELMESFVRDLMTENYTEDLNELSKLLITLFKTNLPIEHFIQYSGLIPLSLCLEKFVTQKKFILNCFTVIREICFSSNENKKKLLEINIQDKIQLIIDKSNPEEKKIKFEGKILIHNLKYDKKNIPICTYSAPLSYIKKEKMIRKVIYNMMVKGIPVKAPNPRGKIKDFILSFSPDLLKIYLKKPKIDSFPPKSKYTIETLLVNEIVRNFEIVNFKKSGLFNKPPEKELCLAVIQELLEGQKNPKKIIIICSHPFETYNIWGCIEIIVDYIKIRFEKPNICNIDNLETFFNSIMQNQPKKQNSDRKRTIIIRGNI